VTPLYADQGVIRFQTGLPANTTVTPFRAPIAAGEEVEWLGAEWFFQAWKTASLEARRAIHAAATWRLAKQLGQKVPMRPGWDTGEPVAEQQRIRVMLAAHRFKFEQHAESREWLKGTGAATLVEARDDPFWGIGPDGRGPNWQGRCLMWTRDVLFPDDPPF
jgi:ribA/ribD-fused uncharacterized protein